MGDQVEEWLEAAMNEMIKMKDEQPDLALPVNFLDLYNSPDLVQFIRSTLAYAVALFPSNESDPPLPLKRLEALAKEMALHYGQLLLNQSKIKQTRRQELTFYETLFFFIAKVIRPQFTKQQVAQLEDELSRLFRSMAFNISQRKHHNQLIRKKYPMLKPYPDKDHIIKTVLVRKQASREQRRIPVPETWGNRPAFAKMSALNAINARSPLISLLLPSPADQVRQFEMTRKRRRNSLNITRMRSTRNSV